MTGSNLPPGVTPSDIDKHFGGPDPDEYVVAGMVGFSVKVLARNEPDAEDSAVERLKTIAEQHDGVELIDPEIEVTERS